MPIDIDGEQLTLIIRGKNTPNPVLLICDGGSGISEYLLKYIYPTDPADDFVTCCIEYRGTGKSYDPAADISEITTERYLADVFSISEHLRNRLNRRSSAYSAIPSTVARRS